MFLLKDTSKICGIAQKKYGSSMKTCLNHAFRESQKRKKFLFQIQATKLFNLEENKSTFFKL